MQDRGLLQGLGQNADVMILKIPLSFDKFKFLQ